MNKHELADAMIKGAHVSGVVESKNDYLSTKFGDSWCFACALGCALIGKYGGDYLEAEMSLDKSVPETVMSRTIQGIFAHLLNIPIDLAVEIEHKHLNGMLVQQIAAWLKSSEGEAVNV